MAHTGNIDSVDTEASPRPRRSNANAERGATSIASVIPPSGGPIPACPRFVLRSVPALPSTPSSADFFQGPRHVLAPCCGSATLVTDVRRSTSYTSRHSRGAASPARRAVRGLALRHRRDPGTARRHGRTRWRVRRHDLDHHGRSPGQRDHHPGLGIDIRPIRHTPSRPGRSADADGGVDGLCLRSGPVRSPRRPRGARDRPRRRRGRHRRGARRAHPAAGTGSLFRVRRRGHGGVDGRRSAPRRSPRRYAPRLAGLLPRSRGTGRRGTGRTATQAEAATAAPAGSSSCCRCCPSSDSSQSRCCRTNGCAPPSPQRRNHRGETDRGGSRMHDNSDKASAHREEP